MLLLALPCAEAFFHAPSVGYCLPNTLALPTQLRSGVQAASLARGSALSGKRQQRHDGVAVLRASHAETDTMVLDRRSVLLAALFAGCQPAFAYDFREEIVGQCGIQVPAIWKRIDGEGGVSFADPVSGVVLQRLSVSTLPVATKGGGIKDLGEIEKLNLVKALGVRAELGKADMVGAARRGKSKATAYDYDLAIAPKTCTREQEIVSGSCAYTEVLTLPPPLLSPLLPPLPHPVPAPAPPCAHTRQAQRGGACNQLGGLTGRGVGGSQVTLLSAFVEGEELKVLEVSASAEQWKKNGPALRKLRASFKPTAP